MDIDSPNNNNNNNQENDNDSIGNNNSGSIPDILDVSISNNSSTENVAPTTTALVPAGPPTLETVLMTSYEEVEKEMTFDFDLKWSEVEKVDRYTSPDFECAGHHW